MASLTAFLTLVLATAPLSPAPALPGGDTDETLRSLLRGRVEMLQTGLDAHAGGVRLRAGNALASFYSANGFRPVWVSSADSPRRSSLARAIRSARTHGLDPEDYRIRQVDSLFATLASGLATSVDSADAELLASDAFLLLGSHLLLGRVNPETIDPEWIANRRSRELHAVLEDALRTDRVDAALERLAPVQPRYKAMRSALSRLRRASEEGGWPIVPDGPTLKSGDTGERVGALRARLRASGDLPGPPGYADQEETFDEETAESVRRFQGRHGLDQDGAVGRQTLAALNVPPAARARQIETNMERWRWLPDDLGARHIEVNIASFEATVVEHGSVVRRHRAVVGRQYRQTPSFTGSMTYLVLSPYWHVPPTIAAVDKLPVIRQDPGAIAQQRMTLLEQSTNRPIEPSSIDWASITGPEFNRRYRLRQEPGPHNALGAVKFMFPNRHNVYLHDTPSRELFDRTVRNFSSGCIRIENALDLAEYLLAAQDGWDRPRIDAAARAATETTVRLAVAVPVHLLYWTAWADEKGVLHFRDDIYGRDATVHAALVADAPGA